MPLNSCSLPSVFAPIFYQMQATNRWIMKIEKELFKPLNMIKYFIIYLVYKRTCLGQPTGNRSVLNIRINKCLRLKS